MQIETSIILPGGWHYKDKAGYRIPLRGELPGAKEVIAAIMQHRLENNIEVGDPQADLENYVCTNFPQWCRRGATQPPININPVQGRNVDVVITWANALYTTVGRLQLVPQREAEARAQVCEACPAQMMWENDCPPCVTSAQRLLSILRQGRDTQPGLSSTLHGCALYKWDNRTACHVDKVHLNTQEVGAPPPCWARKL